MIDPNAPLGRQVEEALVEAFLDVHQASGRLPNNIVLCVNRAVSKVGEDLYTYSLARVGDADSVPALLEGRFVDLRAGAGEPVVCGFMQTKQAQGNIEYRSVELLRTHAYENTPVSVLATDIHAFLVEQKLPAE